MRAPATLWEKTILSFDAVAGDEVIRRDLAQLRALLSALRPFVAEDVASQFDRALRLAGMAGMARAALGQLEHRAEGGEHSV